MYSLLNDELERNSTLRLQDVKCSFFLTIENNFVVEIHRCLCAAYVEEDLMNLRNIQRFESMFQDGRINIQDNEHDVRQNCVMRMGSSQRSSSSHNYWHAKRDGSILFT